MIRGKKIYFYEADHPFTYLQVKLQMKNCSVLFLIYLWHILHRKFCPTFFNEGHVDKLGTPSLLYFKKRVFKKISVKISVTFKYNDLWTFTKDLQIVSDLFPNKVLNNINICTVLYSSRIRLISYIDWLAMQIESDTPFLASKSRNLFSLFPSGDLICWTILLTLTVPFSLI